MSIKTTDTFKAKSRGTPADVFTFFETNPPARLADSKAVINRVYDLCQAAGIDFSLAVSRIADETGALNGPSILVSDIYRERMNIGGLGVTDGGDEGLSFTDPIEAADAYMAHLFTYVLGDDYDVLGVTPADDPRFDATPKAWRGSVKTLDDLRGKWFTNPDGATNSAARGNRIFKDLLDQTGGQPVPLFYTDIPGLPGGLLQTTHPVQIKIIPEWRTNNRPGISARTPRRSVQHGNGNPNSSAAGEANYLFNGAEGRQASYHSATDDKETWIMVPANEVTWQAADGSGPGNMNGFSNEMVEDNTLWANPTRRDRVIANAAELMGGIAARLGIEKPEQHWTFNFDDPNRHDCPNKLRHVTIDGRPAWDIYAEKWRAAKVAELGRMNGDQPAPTPAPTPKPPAIYADAITIWMGDDLKKASPSDHSFMQTVDGEQVKVKVWGAEREYECLKSTPRYQGPDSKGKKVGGNLVVGEEFVGSYVCAVGSTRWLVTRYGSWILAARCTPRVSVRAA